MIHIIYCEINEKDYLVIKETEEKVLKNILSRFDYQTDIRNHVIINKIKNEIA